MADERAVVPGATMRAVVLRAFGGPEQLDYCTVPVPRPAEGDVLVEVHAVSINQSFDLGIRRDGDGRHVMLPTVLGADPSGVVRALGAGVRSIAVGDRVAFVPIRCGECARCRSGAGECTSRFHLGLERWGGDAEYVAAPAWALAPVPDDIDFPDATVIARHYATAHGMLHGVARLTAGEQVLVMGCAGGLGSAGVEVARELGARVIAAAGADERVAAGESLGADSGVNYRRDDLAEAVMRATGGRGVDVVFENIADPSTFPQALACLARNGRLVTAGAHGGRVVPLDVRTLYGRRLSVLGSSATSKADVDWAFDAGVRGRLHPLIGAVLPLSKARDAHEMLERREVVGKVILSPILDR